VGHALGGCATTVTETPAGIEIYTAQKGNVDLTKPKDSQPKK
jgi:hypothetical protein